MCCCSFNSVWICSIHYFYLVYTFMLKILHIRGLQQNVDVVL
nr:MAG TPA: hypothetical protein [Caudoviricetes sp.]